MWRSKLTEEQHCNIPITHVRNKQSLKRYCRYETKWPSLLASLTSLLQEGSNLQFEI